MRAVIAVVVIILVVAGAVAIFGKKLQLFEVADTDTEGFDACRDGILDISGPSFHGYGAYRDPDGDSRKRGELFSGVAS